MELLSCLVTNYLCLGTVPVLQDFCTRDEGGRAVKTDGWMVFAFCNVHGWMDEVMLDGWMSTVDGGMNEYC